MGMKFQAVSQTEVKSTFGGGERHSTMRDACKTLADDVRDFLASQDASVTQLWAKFVEGDEAACVGFKWMDLEEKIQDACKREKGGGMQAVESNLNRNFATSHGFRARLIRKGKTAESGEIYFVRHTPVKKSA